jgi:hypothetical protein
MMDPMKNETPQQCGVFCGTHPNPSRKKPVRGGLRTSHRAPRRSDAARANGARLSSRLLKDSLLVRLLKKVQLQGGK